VKAQTWQTTLLLILVGLAALIGLNSFVIINPGQAGRTQRFGQSPGRVALGGIALQATAHRQCDIYDVTVQKFEVPAQSSTRICKI
jgi:regulator of protease activity HflC (stomatin/prohibitin superfamily)